MIKKEHFIITHFQWFRGKFHFKFRILSYKRRMIIDDEEEQILAYKKDEAKQLALVKDSESEEDELLNLDDSDLELGEEKKEELPEKQIDPDQIQQPKPLKKKKKKCTLSNHDSKKEEKTLHSLHDP